MFLKSATLHSLHAISGSWRADSNNLRRSQVTKKKKPLTRGRRNAHQRTEREFSKLKAMNEDLTRLNKIRSEFISIVSHELRTPLTAIKEGISIVLDGIDGPINEAQKETLEITKNSVDRLTRLINNVLNFSKIEAGHLEISCEKTNVNQLVAETCSLMKLAIRNKDIIFNCHLTKETIIAYCDADKIRQVVINLIDNAIKFTDHHGEINLNLQKIDHRVMIQVQDTGIGIKEEDQKKIFDMFRQSPNKEMLNNGGFGVGLAVCKKIMEQHGGSINLQSTFGKGSTFTITFPLNFSRDQ